MGGAGRSCPLHYRYGAAALGRAPRREVDTLYVVGGLYGNPVALDALEALLALEPAPCVVCFNGDFNWFNVDAAGFADINRRVLAHEAILGNVEAELLPDADEDGCGCGYPATVDDATVQRSNAIHARLKATARRYPAVLARLSTLPMFACYRVGALEVGVVHGDADALAGWRFDPAALDDPGEAGWRGEAFRAARVHVFASSHTCLPALRRWADDPDPRMVINNGAAGMPNFSGRSEGVVSRIALTAPPVAPLYGQRVGATRVDALPLAIDPARWLPQFLANWPAGSAAHVSYLRRILHGPEHTTRHAGAAP